MSKANPASWPFSVHVLLITAISLGAAGINLFNPAAFISIIVNLLCLGVLVRIASRYAKERRAGFDPVVAAETIVAFGVFSLVVGLVSVGLRFLFGLADFQLLQNGQFLDFLPFLEGLATAGFAPVAAIYLRLRTAELDSGVDAVGDLLELSRATTDLTQQMIAAKKAIETFGTGADAAGKSTAGLASAMKSEANKWGLALQEGQAHVKTFGTAAKEGSTDVSALAEETRRLKSAAAETSKLLDELARLIASVERFVAPRAKA